MRRKGTKSITNLQNIGIVHSGILTKSPPNNKTLVGSLKKWKERFFILYDPSNEIPSDETKEKCLIYYKNRHEETYIGESKQYFSFGKKIGKQ